MTSRKSLWIALGAGALIPISVVAMWLDALHSASVHLRSEGERVSLEIEAGKEPGDFHLWASPTPWNLAKGAPGEGETDQGIELLASCWRLGDRLAGPRNLDGLLSCLRARRESLEILEEYLRTVDLSRDQLKRIAESLELVDTSPENLLEAYRFSDLYCRKDLLAALKSPTKNTPWGRVEPEPRHFYSSTITVSRLLHQMDRFKAGLHDRMRLKGLGRKTALEGWTKRGIDGGAPTVLAKLSEGTYEVFEMDTRATIHLHLARASVAIARYIKERGTPPSSLEALVPGYLKAVPADPYLDAPLKYKFDAIDATVYALGWDGDDDGGRDISDYGHDGDFAWVVRIRDAEPK